ncbi:hypothetical protein ACFU9X_33860 [Streptomyces atratus]|uniref:hypothetical protein n=1 Tax=Streptomyces atratus TaxID=1893 RepID=UPI0036A57045
MHISEMFRLVRGNQHILDVLDVLHRDRLALRIHDGVFSAMDLTARHPRTGELLSTMKFMVQTLAAAGELQRELTYDGLRAAEVPHRQEPTSPTTDTTPNAQSRSRRNAPLREWWNFTPTLTRRTCLRVTGPIGSTRPKSPVSRPRRGRAQ